MRISAPCPEIGAPKVGKMWGLGTNSVCIIFFRFLACVLYFRSTNVVQNFGWGRYPLPKIWQKNGVCYLEQCTLQRLVAQLAAGRMANGRCHITAVLQLLLIRSRQHGAACIWAVD